MLGLPRGGIPVAYEVSLLLRAPLDVLVVRKLGVPGREELAFGAIAGGGVRVLNADVLATVELGPEQIERVTVEQQLELERRELAYRGAAPPLSLGGRTVLLVDDGLATGATMRAAVQAARALGASPLVAIPVAPQETCSSLRECADAVICLSTPEPFCAVGLWYDEFAPTGDDEVRDLLGRARRR